MSCKVQCAHAPLVVRYRSKEMTNLLSIVIATEAMSLFDGSSEPSPYSTSGSMSGVQLMAHDPWCCWNLSDPGGKFSLYAYIMNDIKFFRVVFVFSSSALPCRL